MRGGFSAPRRPRSAFKESSQEETLSLRAPRERSRKEKPVLGSSASSSSRNRNNKKKRSALSEVQFTGSDHDQEEDGYETAEQLSPSPSRGSPGFSDEDDEPPQARRRRESSSSALKLRLPHKVPESNIISAGLCSIPRKARSAFAKRVHEGISSAPPISDVTATAMHCFSATKAPSPPNCNGRIRSVSPSPSAAKPTRKMKPIGTRPRPAKFPKVTTAFSEQEVEVAEVLFGFARQITSAEESLNDVKATSSSSPSLPPNISSPIRASSPISASPSLLSQPTEGPKMKMPRPTKIDEIGSPDAPPTAHAYCQSTGMDFVSSDNADGVGGFIKEIANELPPTTSATQNYITSSSFGQRYGELIRETVTVSEKIRVKFEDSDVVAPVAEAKTTDVPVKVDGASESETNQIEIEKIDRQTDVLPSVNPIVQFESPVMSPSTLDAKNASLEKMEIDLMVPPEKEANSSENDNTFVAVDRTKSELPAEGTMGVSSLFEGKFISIDKIRDQEKREDGAECKEMEKSSCKGDIGEESVIEQHIKEEKIEENNCHNMRGSDNDPSKQLPQKPGRITRTDSRIQKLDKPDVPSAAGSASCAVSISGSGAAGPSPMSMAVAGWSGALSALRYFGPTAGTWSGTPSLPGMMPVEGNLTKGIQQWQMFKRSATHAYIAHFIDYQQQMARNPFWATTYGNSTALYGGKPYNLNIPLASATETILGSPLPGSDSLSAQNSNIMGSSFNDSNIATAALAAISGHNLKEKAASSYMDVLRKNSAQQQEAHPTSSVTIQHNLPSFGFPITESGTSTSAIAVNTGNATSLVNGKNSGTGLPLHTGASTNLAGGTGAANSSFATIANAQAQYLAMLQQNGFHFPVPPVHFGATNTGTHNHLGHPQVYNGSFYAAQLLHQPTHPQQQGQQNQSNTGSSSQKLQQQFNFSSPQQQTPSSSQQHHLFSPSQTSQAERGTGYTNGVDTALTADRKLPLGQKNLYSQGSPINSSNNANPATLLATNSLGHSQDFTMMTAFGGKHNVKQQQMQISMQPNASDPNLEISLKGQQCNQSTKQAVSRVKAQSTLSNYGDQVTGASNLSKFQEASISGQSQKQQDQHPPEWKVSSTVPTSAGTSHQAVVAGAIRNSSQQVRHQQVSSNLLANLPGGAIPQAVFTTSTKNYGQQSRNQHGNSSSASMSKSKTTGIPTSKTVTGSKGTVSLPQRSIAPTSGKRSSPNHMAPSLSGNKPSQQQQTTQSASSIASGQVMGSKNQQYYTQAHFNPQQSYSPQIHQQLIFQQNHFLQQAVQQSQLSSQSAQHAVVQQQHLQIQGLNYSQPSLNNRHPQPEQWQQILPASSTPTDQVPSSTLLSGLPSLSLGSASNGRSPAKIMPAGTTVLHEQYSPLNDRVSTQKQCDSATLSPHLAQAASVLQKSPEQKSQPDGLPRDEVNGVHLVDLNICAQARTHVSASSVQTSSIQKTTGNLKKAQGGNNEESISGQGGTNLSVVPSGHTYQDLGSASSEQTPSMPIQQSPVSRASGPISSVISNPHEATASIVQL